MTDWSPLRALGFTGARTLRTEDVGHVMDDARHHILNPLVRCFVTGACTGVDALLGRYAADLRRDAAHIVVVPADESKVDPWWQHRVRAVRDLTMPEARQLSPAGIDRPGIYVCRMPAESTYRDRDVALVVASDRLRGYAAWPEDHPRSKRSGTWLTKRIADVYQRPIDMTVLR